MLRKEMCHFFFFFARPILEWVKKFLLSFIALEDGKWSGICCLDILFDLVYCMGLNPSGRKLSSGVWRMMYTKSTLGI